MLKGLRNAGMDQCESLSSCVTLWTVRLQKEGSDDSTPSSERLSVHLKGEDERGGMHVKGESTESELDEEEEDEDIIQLREGDEEERGSYAQVWLRSKTTLFDWTVTVALRQTLHRIQK